MKEIWKDIPNCPNYQVSNLGRIKSLPRKIKMPYGGYKITKEIIMKNKTRNNGYSFITIKHKNFDIHRLVALLFISNPNNYTDVNHIDENKSNNIVNNLEWCTHKYNCNYGNRNIKVANSKCKKINQYDINGNFIKQWNSIISAEKTLKLNNIGRCCNKQYKSIGGYIWRYANK